MDAHMRKEALEKFFSAPGLCNKTELLIVKEFLAEYKEYRDVYVSVRNYTPEGLTLESNLDSVEWYLNRLD